MSEDKKAAYVMDVNKIKEILPHRYPFLMVDRVLSMDVEAKTLVAIKNVTADEPFFQGHYPNYPVMPGVLQMEAMAQTAAIFLLSLPENENKVPFFTGIDGGKFRKQVVPGDQLVIECSLVRLKRRVAKCKARCLVDGEVTVEAELTCMLSDPQ